MRCTTLYRRTLAAFTLLSSTISRQMLLRGAERRSNMSRAAASARKLRLSRQRIPSMGDGALII
jgi:hypothetical protein